jgi:hypothetical protein
VLNLNFSISNAPPSPSRKPLPAILTLQAINLLPMSEILSSNLFAALLGTFIGAYLSFWLTRRNDKVKLTMDFHKEWHSYDMSLHRRLAYHCIKQFPDTNYNNLTSADEKGSISIFIVLRFYQRLWQCFDNGSLNRQLTATLFYENFYWYYFISYVTSLKAAKEDWPAYYEIEQLKVKIREYTSEADYQKYQKKYTEKYNEYVTNKPASNPGTGITQKVKSITIQGTGNFQIS